MNPWTFVCAADIHVGTPRSYRFRPAWNENWQTAREQIIGLAPDLLILGGDLTRDGSTHRFELEQIKADLDSLPFPWCAVPGNHEAGDKWGPDVSTRVQPEYLELYRSVIGPDCWSFVHRDMRFSGFNSFLAGSGLPDEEDFWVWFEAQAREPRAKHHVWFMHSALYIDDLHEPNWNPETDRNAWYFGIDEPHRSRMMRGFRDAGADLVVTGHVHCRRSVVVEGITFQLAPATAFEMWRDRWPDGDSSLGILKCEVTDDGIEPHFVPLTRASRRKDGYGPGGNPPLEGRDYSVAWEQPPLDINEQRFPVQH